MKPIAHLRLWSLAQFTVFLILWIIFMTINPLAPQGLFVHIPKIGAFTCAPGPEIEPLVVRVDVYGNLYLNRRPVALRELGGQFQNALCVRSDWTVYIGLDPDAVYRDAVQVADLFLGAGGKRVVLVTPSIKKEVSSLGVVPPCEVQPLQDRALRLPPKWRGHWHDDLPIISFDVAESGSVSHVEVEKRGAIPGLDQWAVQSVSKWKFKSTQGCGNPTRRMNAWMDPSW